MSLDKQSKLNSQQTDTYKIHIKDTRVKVVRRKFDLNIKIYCYYHYHWKLSLSLTLSIDFVHWKSSLLSPSRSEFRNRDRITIIIKLCYLIADFTLYQDTLRNVIFAFLCLRLWPFFYLTIQQQTLFPIVIRNAH